ncbi:MAG: hypothetical protein HW415_614 [Deltaproteobacteria bacterium]|nr:hypothetical protein [Deltaproteobacteria bacterium]
MRLRLDKEGLIITGDTAEELEQDGVAITMLPLYRWLLE